MRSIKCVEYICTVQVVEEVVTCTCVGLGLELVSPRNNNVEFSFTSTSSSILPVGFVCCTSFCQNYLIGSEVRINLLLPVRYIS